MANSSGLVRTKVFGQSYTSLIPCSVEPACLRGVCGGTRLLPQLSDGVSLSTMTAWIDWIGEGFQSAVLK
jgi:hypothetical protein